MLYCYCVCLHEGTQSWFVCMSVRLSVCMHVHQGIIITHNADAVAVSSSFYGKSHRKLHYNWVECTGTETNITQCSHGKVNNDNSEKCAHVAGVICRNRNPRAQTNGIMHEIIHITSHDLCLYI